MSYSTKEFEQIYKGCFPQAMRLAVGMLHDEEEARDVVQRVFAKLWEAQLPMRQPRAFVLRSVHNAALNRLTAMQVRERVKRNLPIEPAEHADELERRFEAVQRAVRQVLSDRERQVVEKIYAEGLSYKQAAESLQVSVSAINKNVVSALKKLRTHFKTNGNHD